MTKTEEGGGGAVGKLWRKHGGGYYALLAVGTFMYLEFTSLTSSIREAGGVRDFLVSELFTFAIESIVNTLLASLWPFMWYRWMGTDALPYTGSVGVMRSGPSSSLWPSIGERSGCAGSWASKRVSLVIESSRDGTRLYWTRELLL